MSDRRQPEGKVCLYIFIPNNSRKTYNPAVYTESQIRGFADISSIADTWGNGEERNAALARYHAISVRDTQTANANSVSKNTALTSMELVINDALTYSSAKDFRSREAALLYKELIETRQQYRSLSQQLEQWRNNYLKATGNDKQSIARDILQAETEIMQLYSRIQTLEKETRNAEIEIIK